MPVPPLPPLPLEIVGLIGEQVRLSCGNDDSARHSSGLSIALVCRDWRSLGTGMFWHSVVLTSPEQARLVHEHLADFPGLALFVKTLRLIRCAQLGPASSRSASAQESAVHIDAILSRCSRVRHLAHTANWVDALPVMLSARHLASIRVLEMHALSPNYPSAPALVHHLQGMPNLVFLAVTCIFQSQTFRAFPPPVSSVLLLETVVISRTTPTTPDAGCDFAVHLLRSISPSSLRCLTLLLQAGDDAVIKQLPRFSALSKLSVDLNADVSPRPIFDLLLKTMAACPSLCTVAICSGSERCDLRTTQTATLLSFLDTLPSTPGISLTGYYFSYRATEERLSTWQPISSHRVLQQIVITAEAAEGEEVELSCLEVACAEHGTRWYVK